jgi:superfamily II DNA or RNA helicase
MSIRAQRQKEFAEVALEKKRGLLHLCSRFGKIKTCFNFINETDKVLVIYPKAPIKQSWLDDSVKWEFDISNFKFSTTSSLHKIQFERFDWIIWDEPQEVLSDKVLGAIKVLSVNNNIIGLSGSLSADTQFTIRHKVGLSIIADYPTSLAIKEGVITDYEIFIKYTNLETEAMSKYNWLTREITTAINQRNNAKIKFLALSRMRLLYNSSSKLDLAKRAITRFKDDRFILFSHLTKFVDDLGIPVYHSKNKDEEVLQKFKDGEIDHLATLDMISAGISFKKLSMAIIATFTSNAEELYQRINRITATEMDNPNKKAVVYILCLKDTQEEKWLDKALLMFDPKKIRRNG